MCPMARLILKTSEPAKNGLVGSTPTRLRQSSCGPSYGVRGPLCEVGLQCWSMV